MVLGARRHENIDEGQLNLFRETVLRQVNAKKQELEAEKRKERVHITLDFSFLKNYMAKGGLVMEVMKCPECGASLKFPDSGDQTECKHCGNTIYAQDLFEKVKKLIG